MRLTRRFGFLLLLAIFVAFPSRSAFTSRTKSPQGFYTGSITINVRTGKFPISGARVKVVRVISLSSTNIRMETFKGRTNRYGEYHLGGLRTGTYSIHVEVPGYSPQVDEVVVGPNLTKPFYAYEMIPGESRMGVITGRVLDSLGKGISKARVSIVQDNTGIEYPSESDTEGNYEQTGLLPGKYTLTAQAKKYNSSSKMVKMGERQVLKQNFKLKPR